MMTAEEQQHYANLANAAENRRLVERLRDRCDRKFINVLCAEAADEIERLMATLKAIERHTAPSTRTWDTCLRDMGLANDLARAALEPKP